MTEPSGPQPPRPDQVPYGAMIHRLLDMERRTMIAARMLPDEGPLTDSQRQEIRDAVKGHLAAHKMSQQQLAREIGTLRASTLSEILSGEYGKKVSPEKLDAALRAMNNAIEVDARRRAAGTNRRFVETTVATKILIAAQQASSKSIIAVVHGPSGIGKTMCAEALITRYPGSIYLRLDDETRSSRDIRQALREHLRLDGGRGRTPVRQGKIHRRIVDTLRGSGRMLIIDEAHKIGDSGLEYLRDVYDLCAVPVLLLCTKDLVDRIRRDADPDHGQLYSRIDYVCDLWARAGEAPGRGQRLFSISDILKLWQTDAVRIAPDAQAYLLDLANRPGFGSLRSCGNLLRWAERALRAKHGAEAKITITAELLLHIEREQKPDWSMRSDMEARRGDLRKAVSA